MNTECVVDVVRSTFTDEYYVSDKIVDMEINEGDFGTPLTIGLT